MSSREVPGGRWTPELLFIHFNALHGLDKEKVEAALASADKAVQAALAAAEKAVLKAESAADRRFDSVNELRGMVQDILSTTMPRGEAESRIAQGAEKVDVLASRMDRMEASVAGAQSQKVERRTQQSSTQASIGTIFGAIAAVVTLLGFAVLIATTIAN